MNLTALEHGLATAIMDSLEDVKNFSWHISLKRTIDALWQQSYYAPSPGTFYMLWDHMVP